MRIEEELFADQGNEDSIYSQIFNVQKEILDEFISFALMHSYQAKSPERVSSLESFKLSDLQKRTVENLRQAYTKNRNRILCD